MVWNSNNRSFAGSPNFAAYGALNFAPNFAAYSAANFAAYGSPNFAAYGSPNFAAYGSPNFAAYAAPNFAAYGSPNFAAYPARGALPGPMLAPGPETLGGTGAGGATGSGFLGGYGPVARFEYATPAGLAPLPWALDFANGDGWPPFPLRARIDPQKCKPPLQWQPEDWDPALRFWSLPFDPHLTEWLQDLTLGAPAVMAAREFAARHADWLASDKPSALQTQFETGAEFLGWRDGRVQGTRPVPPWTIIDGELEELADLMRDDRMRYLEELAVQSGQAVPYFVHLMGFDPATKPWTMELMNCASAIGNLVKMQYKSHYKRVRPSHLCPGLVPPWGPPRHPSFPSGHSTVAHLTAMFLLSVKGIEQRFGVFATDSAGTLGQPLTLAHFMPTSSDNAYGQDQRSPLLWVAWRIAKGRERLGLHYASDSAAGRRLAAVVWHACLRAEGPALRIEVPALRSVLHRAQAEWLDLAS